MTAIVDQQQGDGYSRSMSYDGLDRLTSATSAAFGGGQTYRYTYDALDNMTSAKLAGVRQHNYWYDANQRLTNVVDDAGATIVGLSYDAQGGNPPAFSVRQKWSYAAIANFIAGVIPPSAMLGRSWLYVHSQRVALS
ncbi:RHS repeat domain-containing protein [Xanthomonas vasicola]|uniref:RHS repeat domain-containing protein n=1 Tax=Xanthomonas vasicola TaxID=56459 RepID=UPI001FC93621|nr:RHS repeat domain-containing protein [Xanthomonas vasicola]